MSTKKALNHSAILSDLKSNFVDKNKGRNYSNNTYIGKIHTLDKSVNTIKTLKNTFINDKNFYGSEIKGDKKNKENNFQNNNNKIDIKISINNYGKHSIDKKAESCNNLKESILYKPKSNISISKKNESLESDSILQNNLNSSTNNLEKTKFKLKNSGISSLKFTQALIHPTKVANNNNSSFAFNPKLRNNYTSTSHPPLKTDANDFKDDKLHETSFQNTGDNFNKEVLHTEPYNNSNKFVNKGRNSKLSAIESQIDNVLNKAVEKKNENLNEKLNLYKTSFDDAIRLGPPEMIKVLTKIHNGYIDVIQKLIGKLNSKTTELDTLSTKYNSITKKYDEQHDEVRFLKKKLTDFYKVSENSSTNIPSHNHINNFIVMKNSHVNTNDIQMIGHNEVISNMNKVNINDLEALYFVDKIQMRSNSVSENNIPKLDFNVFNQQERENASIKQIKNYEEYKKLQVKENKAVLDKYSVSPMKMNGNDPERFSINKSPTKKLAINNINDTILEKDKLSKITNNTTKNVNYNPFRK